MFQLRSCPPLVFWKKKNIVWVFFCIWASSNKQDKQSLCHGQVIAIVDFIGIQYLIFDSDIAKISVEVRAWMSNYISLCDAYRCIQPCHLYSHWLLLACRAIRDVVYLPRATYFRKIHCHGNTSNSSLLRKSTHRFLESKQIRKIVPSELQLHIVNP